MSSSLISCLVLLLSLPAGAQGARPGYVLSFPKAPVGGSTNAYGISEDGTVLGNSRVPGQDPQATFWAPGGAERLGIFVGSQSWAYARNASGVIAANTNGSSEGERAFLWRAGARFELDVAGQVRTIVRDLADSGQAVGTTFGAGNYRAAVWDAVTLEGSLVPLPPHLQSLCTGVNEAGRVVGNMRLLDGCWRGFRLDGTSLEFLEPLPGYACSALADVNDLGVAVGNSQLVLASVERRPVVWAGDEVRILPGLDGAVGSYCAGINNHGHVIGASDDVPWLQVDGRVHELRELADLDGWTYRFAYDLNDAGQIVGNGTLDDRGLGYLLTPMLANLDRDADVDGHDLELFRRAHEVGDLRADVDRDGDVDAADAALFEDAWQRGY